MEVSTIIYITIILGALNSLLKAVNIYLNNDQRHRLSDPLYLILMAIALIFAIGLLFNDTRWWPWSLGGLAFANWAILRLTDEDYDIEKGVKNGFRAAKRCPHCMKSLPSYFTTKCPHCTADL